jgi:hypothetical protein
VLAGLASVRKDQALPQLIRAAAIKHAAGAVLLLTRQ